MPARHILGTVIGKFHEHFWCIAGGISLLMIIWWLKGNAAPIKPRQSRSVFVWMNGGYEEGEG